MASERDEELAWTETAVADASAPVMEPAAPTLGRYRIERELGAGAMGVVHAAFDPDLERRVALKVLKNASASVEARDRLLREARAMARLTHANVVTVHEVGTVAGRDYVAMELIHGEPLAEWLRQTSRPAAAILEAFVAAGRGLAAAHAAGIVHRDFKPHNVLRGRDGRIVVTDFGLARQTGGDRPPALDAILPADPASGAASLSGTPSSLAGLTMAGSLLGTPAYMAPEQWAGGQVTPATDQFAYCVALWEALAGERPYRGPTFDDLRAQVARGPAALDASRIPRRVRGLLRRGLDPEPARRWPSMGALLAQLARAQRRPSMAIALAAVALAIGAVILALQSRTPVAACDPPAREVASVWSPAIAAALRAATAEAHAAVIDGDVRDWQAARATVCAAPPQVRAVQLPCLDAALARLDALRRAAERVSTAAAEEIQAQMVDPAICTRPAAGDVPRLTVAPAPEVIDAYALLARTTTDARPSDREILALAEARAAPACARVIAAFAFDDVTTDAPRARSVMTGAVTLVDQCGDDRLRADLLIRLVPYEREWPTGGRNSTAALAHAEVAAGRVMQPDVAAAIAKLRWSMAWQANHWDELLRLSEVQIAGYGARGEPTRQIRTVIERDLARMGRLDPGDHDAIAADIQTWRPKALSLHRADLVWRFDFTEASLRLVRGEVARAHGDLQRLWQSRPDSVRSAQGRAVSGKVVDGSGHPVPGATVAAAFTLFADTVGIGLPIIPSDLTLRITTTDADGAFAFRDAPAAGAIAAQLGDRRSGPAEIADHVTLVVESTRSVSGTVDLGGVPYLHIGVVVDPADATTARLHTIAPVSADGAFSISGVPVGAFTVRAVVRDNYARGEGVDFRRVPASPRSVDHLALAIATSSRTLDVVVSSAVSTTLEGATVYVLSGKWQFKNFGEMIRSPAMGAREIRAEPVTEASIPAAVAGTIHKDDLLTHFEHVAAGDLTVCACNVPGDMIDPMVRERLRAHLSDLAVTCKQIGPDAGVVVLAVAPQQRLD